jgi:hypothetical protein
MDFGEKFPPQNQYRSTPSTEFSMLAYFSNGKLSYVLAGC